MSTKAQDIETSKSLLGKNSEPNPDPKQRCCTVKRCLCVLSVIVIIMLILVGIAAVIFLTDIGKPARCIISDGLSLGFPECEHHESLDSLSNLDDVSSVKINQTAYIEKIKASCEEQKNATGCGEVKEFSEQDLAYIALAETSWTAAWDIVHDSKGWEQAKGSTIEAGRVEAKSYEGIGKVSKLQAHVDLSCANLFHMIITDDTDTMLSWNPSIDQLKVIYAVTNNIDVIYVGTNPTAGGIISARDFVNLRHWKTRDGVRMCSEISTEHPDAPEGGDVIRVINAPAAIMFSPIDGEPNKCFLERSICPDIGGWIPRWIVDDQVAQSLMDFLGYVRDRVDVIKANGQI